MTRPSISLCCILKNEVHNLPRLLESVRDCFDEIHLTDTGSTDGSIELIESYIHSSNPSNCPIFLHHFKWIDDFAAARNYSFSFAKTDFTAWLDLDDVLSDTKAFIKWRDEIMTIADYWLATYHYAFDTTNRPVCSFLRERVIRTNRGMMWNYFVHEGITARSPYGPINAQLCRTWTVNHMRTPDDMKADRSRNIRLFKDRVSSLDPRMTYYYGKELFENNEPLEAFQWLMKAIAIPELEPHDRILGIQYACLAAAQCNHHERSLKLAHDGLQLSPNRAEFFVLIGDSYIKQNKFVDAIPFYNAAIHCVDFSLQGTQSIFTTPDSYNKWPKLQLARAYVQLGNIDKAFEYAKDAHENSPDTETKGIFDEILKIKTSISHTSGAKNKVKEIVFSCTPVGPYEWDEEIAKERGIGGSEIAVVKMARELHTLTGIPVRIFNNRSKIKELDGVTYQGANECHEYFQKNTPVVNINWRHVTKLTDAPTYIYCHDLYAINIQHHDLYDKVIALSKFHSSFLQNMFNVPAHKIWVSRNGLDTSRFKDVPKFSKNPNRIIYASSPDRGLDRTMQVMDLVHAKLPESELHVYYGFDNMLKMGLHSEVKRFEAMMKDRPFVKYHGNLEQRALANELAQSAIWLYPTNFLETFCITAIESLCAKVYPVVRNFGALTDTLAEAKERGMASLIESDCQSVGEMQTYANAVVKAIEEKAWDKIDMNPETFSWTSVAKEWVSELKL
jgi:glycosyltransferase involved in cell wall biosynthesis